MVLMFTACQNNKPSICIVTCRKSHSLIDIMGIANKSTLLYIDDSTQINLQHIEKPYKYNICLRCQDTLIRISNRLYKALQKQPELYDCSYKGVIEDCLRNPRDTVYTWSQEIYTTVIIPNSIGDEISIIDLMITEEVYNRIFGNNAFVLVTANETTYCDCPVFGYLILQPDSKKRLEQIAVKHYAAEKDRTK